MIQADTRLFANRAAAAVAACQILGNNYLPLAAGRVHDLRPHLAKFLFEALQLPANAEIYLNCVPNFLAQNRFQKGLGYPHGSLGAEPIAAVGGRGVAQRDDQRAGEPRDV